MTRTQAANAAFLGFTGVLIIASASGLAACWPLAIQAAHAQSGRLVADAKAAKLAEAATDYQLATWLDPANQAAYLGLARTQIRSGRPAEAVTTLERAGEGSEAATLQLSTLIELGRYSEAADRAAAYGMPGRNETDVTLAGLAYALAGRTGDGDALKPLVASSEAVRRLERARVGNLPLAAELYASGLPVSARALLVKQPTSFERNMLLAHIAYDLHTPADLSTATDYLVSAVALNPSDITAHEFLGQVYADRGLHAESAAQSILVTKLKSGRP